MSTLDFRFTTRFWTLMGLAGLTMDFTAFGGLQLAWEARYDGGVAFGTNETVAMALDPSGNILVAGSVISTGGNWDYLTVKCAATGERLWARRWASPGGIQDQVRGLAVDREGNVFITGTSLTIKYSPLGTLIWSAPYAGRALAVDTNGNAYITGFLIQDMATVKLAPEGTNVWIRTYDQIGESDTAHAITIGTSGTIVVCGISECHVDQASRYADVVTVNYTRDGIQEWVSHSYGCQLYGRGYNSEFSSRIRAIALDPSENVILTGNLVGLAVVGPFETTKLNAGGMYQWNYWWQGSSEYSAVRDLTLDSSGNVYLVGSVYPMPINASTVFATIKLRTDGSQEWISRYGNVVSGNHYANAVRVDSNGNPYVTGFSAGIGTDNDFVTLKYDTNGNELWVHRYNGPFNGDDQATALAVDQSSGAVYVAGFSQTRSNLTEMVLLKYAELENIQLKTNKEVRLQFFGTPGQVMNFQASTNFPDWEDLGSSITMPDGICRFDDTNAPLYLYRFYRITHP